MKKIKSILGVTLLSVTLAGNAFAGDSYGSGVISFFSGMMNAAYSLISGDDPCRPRDCQQCRPGETDNDPACRPPVN
jgi:hypothetical protein